MTLRVYWKLILEKWRYNMIFDKEFLFKGKHAEYLSQLTQQIDTRTKYAVFERNVDVLIFAPIVRIFVWRKESS